MFDKKNEKGFEIIAIDAGKYELKAIAENGNKFSVRSKVDHTDDTILGNELGTYFLEWENDKYIIGKGANTEDFDLTKEKLHHKLLMFLGISKLIQKEGNDIGVVVGIPATMFFNKLVKERYRNFLGNDRTPNLKFNGVKKDFTIIEIKVAPETMGYVYKRPSIFQNKLVGVINLGGLNANGLIYENLTPIKGTEFTINAGGYILNNKIKHALKSEYGMNVQDYEIPYIIQNGVLINGKESKEGNKIVEDIKNIHLQEVINEMKRKNWNINGLEIHFTGGSSEVLNNVIHDNIQFSFISNNGKWDDAEGLYNIGVMVYAGQKRQYA